MLSPIKRLHFYLDSTMFPSFLHCLSLPPGSSGASRTRPQGKPPWCFSWCQTPPRFCTSIWKEPYYLSSSTIWNISMKINKNSTPKWNGSWRNIFHEVLPMEQQNAQTAYRYRSLQVNLNAMPCLVNFLIFDLNLLMYVVKIISR